MNVRRSCTAAAGILALTLTACGGGGGAEPATQAEVEPGYLAVADDAATAEGPVTVQVDYDSQEDGGLDPQLATTARSWSLFGLVYETLVTVDAEFGFQPGLATSWEQPDETTYIFTIDTSAQFSNGRTLTVDDVAGTLERLKDGVGVWAGQIGPVESVETLDDTRVQVNLSEPYTPFLAALANSPAGILPMEEIESGQVDIATEMLGTGPFVMESHRQDQNWVFSRHEGYRDAENVLITELRVDIVGEDATRQAALREGSTALANFSNVDALSLLANSGATMYSQRQSDFYYILINGLREDSPLNDQDLRFALNAAIDRQALSDSALAGESAPTGVTPSNLPGACDPADLPSAGVGPEDAAGLIEASGYDGEPLDLLVYNSEPVLGQMAQVIQQQLEAAGVTVNIEQLDTAAYYERTHSTVPGDFDMALGWYAGYGDPAMVTRWWNPDIAGFSAAFAGSHEDLNELIDQAAVESEPAAREQVFTELCHTVDEYSEMVPLVHRPGIVGLNPDLLTMDLTANEGYGDFLRYLPTARPVSAG